MDTGPDINSAIDLIASNQLNEGVRILRKHRTSDPANVQVLIWLGRAEFLLGGNEGAIDCLRCVSVLAPDDQSALSFLGQALLDADRADQARRALSRAHMIDADDPDVCFYLGLFCETDGAWQKAGDYYIAAIKGDPQNRQAYLQLAGAQNNQGDHLAALKTLQQAEKQFPGDRDLTYTRGKLASAHVPGWHLPMLTDGARNQAFERAIAETVRPGDTVLDIGTGSGLLAMMAAKAGAGHVYAVEAEPVLAQLAAEIIERNHLQDRVTIIAKHSTDLTVGGDIPEKADVLITETFDRTLVGEGALASINHAREHLLKDGARSIPARAALYGALVECPDLSPYHGIETVSGFDLSPMQLVAHPLQNEDARISFWNADHNRVLSRPFKMSAFDFAGTNATHFESETAVEIAETGNANAILIWFDLELAPDLSISNEPGRQHHHWSQAFQSLLQKVSCSAGDRKVVSARYAGYFDIRVEPV